VVRCKHAEQRRSKALSRIREREGEDGDSVSSCLSDSDIFNDGLSDSRDVDEKKAVPQKVVGYQIAEAVNKNRIEHVFKDLLRKTEHREFQNEEITEYIKYKFKKTTLEQQLTRIKMIHKLGLSQGPIYIICLLRIISLHKQLFVLALEQGREVQIPQILSMSNYP
jgi:hypothetical protein